MERNYYIAVQINENGRNYACMLRYTGTDNLLPVLKIKNIVAANICPTKKAARALVPFWNDCFKNNGTFLFDVMPDGSPAPF